MKIEEIRDLLVRSMTIAVVGMSNRTGRAGHEIPKILMDAGYTVIPVNPNETEILGQKCYPSLAEVPVSIDIVDVFRRATETPEVARQSVAVKAGAVWLQLGIVSDEARAIATSAGLDYVEDMCLGVVVRGLGIKKN